MEHLKQSNVLSECPNCTSSNIRYFSCCIHKKQQVFYQLCHYCGLIFQNPTSSAAEWEEFYSSKYRVVYDGSASPTDRQHKLQIDRAATYSDLLSDWEVGCLESHLDIGCSMGAFLKKTKTELGVHEIAGVEPGREYRLNCQNNGIECVDSVSKLNKKARFDLISMCHVLEHVNKPIQFLRDLVNSHLARDGILFLEVPNVRGSAPFELAHPICFSVKTLTDTIESAGMEVRNLICHGRPKSSNASDRRYIAMLARRRSFSETAPQEVRKVSALYLRTSWLASWRGDCNESWLKFAAKYPFRILKRGFDRKTIR